MDLMRSESSSGYSRDDHGWQKVVSRHFPKKYAAANGGVSGKMVQNESRSYNVFRELMVDPDVGVEPPKEENIEKAIASLSKAAAKMDPSHLSAFLAKEKDMPNTDLWRFYFYLEAAFSQVSFPWLKMFKSSPLSKLIAVPLSHIPTSVYEISADWINGLLTNKHSYFVLWSLDRILEDWAGDSKLESQVAIVVELAMVLRSKPDALTAVFPTLRRRPRYQGPDKLPLIAWMLAQASHGDLAAGLYSWAHVLLPRLGNNKCCTPRSMDLILQFVEIILSNPDARTILVNGAAREGERLIPPSSFEILLRLTFSASSTRAKATKRFEAVYPLLKEVALAPESSAPESDDPPGSATEGNTVAQIFTLSLKLAGEEGNPGLAKEAAAIAVWSLTENVDCFKRWVILYKEHLEASVALLRKLVDEWKHHSPKLSSSPRDTLTVNRTMNSFRQQNEKAITQGGANCSLYKEADMSCKLISRRLSPGSGDLKMTRITAVFLATAIAAAGGIAGAALSSILL